MPRLLRSRRCPHCGVRLAKPPPRVCTECGGSLQQRYLQAGCLSSSPLWLGAVALGWAAARALLG